MKSRIILKLADKIIEVCPMSNYIATYCKSYLINESELEKLQQQIDFSLIIEEPDIQYERKKSEAEDRKQGIPTRHFSDEYLETLAVYRKIAEKMPVYDTILFHGSVIAVDGMGYLFTAKSGTGKSTHTRLWREHFGNRAVMLNDDKPLLKVTADSVIAYGTLWDGKHRLSNPIKVPLSSICVIERATGNSIKRMPIACLFSSRTDRRINGCY